jgi:hypothetical protein
VLNARGMGRDSASLEFEAVVFNHGVRQQLIAHLVELSVGSGFALSLERDLNVLANPHLIDIAVAQVGQP